MITLNCFEMQTLMFKNIKKGWEAGKQTYMQNENNAVMTWKYLEQLVFNKLIQLTHDI